MMLVCLGCRTFLKKKKNGVPLVEGMPGKDGDWTDYKLWMTDLYGCESCGVEVCAGFGQAPIAEHYQADYQAQRDKFQPLARIDDCPGLYRGLSR